MCRLQAVIVIGELYDSLIEIRSALSWLAHLLQGFPTLHMQRRSYAEVHLPVDARPGLQNSWLACWDVL